MQQLTEAEAWRMIGEAFEARAAHPDLEVDPETDIADYGLCAGVYRVTGELGGHPMYKKIDAETGSSVMLQPYPDAPGGSELRATLAYLFAEEAAA